VTIADFCLQLVVVAADPHRCTRERIRDCEGRKRSRQTLSEYAARFGSWYLATALYVESELP
jgi:hypothetical protein